MSPMRRKESGKDLITIKAMSLEAIGVGIHVA
jgi:hypothetical protein